MNKKISSPIIQQTIAALLLGTSFDHLSAASPSLPNSGSILQELNSIPPSKVQEAPNIKITPDKQSTDVQSPPFEVKKIQIEGNQVLDNKSLHDLVQDQEGKQLTLQQLNRLAEHITEHYQTKGYPLARAFVPAQTIANGTVTIQIVEARYGKIHLNNQSTVHNNLLNATIEPLESGTIVEEKNLDKTLLLLSDIPATQVNAKLKPGQDTGTSDLDIDVTQQSIPTANITADNHGNKYIGRARLNGSVSLINPLRYGDILSLNGTSTGSGMDYVRLSYDTLINGHGTRTGLSYSSVDYTLGDSAKALQAHGSANVGSLWLKHPIVRGKNSNIYGQLQFDEKNLKDRLDVSNIKTDRRLRNWMASVSGDIRDNIMSEANSIWSLGVTSGKVLFENLAAEQNDSSTAQTKGEFSKINLNFARLQSINPKNSVYFNFAYQTSNSNLDSSEKMSIGGPYSVRAYDVGAISADKGYQTTIELRHELGSFAQGQLQAIAFIDSAKAQTNQKPWASSIDNQATLSGSGLGVNWTGPNLWKGSLCIASKLGSTPSTVGNSSDIRAWVTLSKSY